MPRYKNGSLIKCEKSIRIYLERLPRSSEFILEVLDDSYLLIKDSEIKYVLEKIADLQNENYQEMKP